MKRKLNSFVALLFFPTFLLCCHNEQQKSSEKKAEKTETQKDTISSIKRVSDSTKIAFNDIEFGMSQDELFQTEVFMGKSTNDLYQCWLTDSYIMTEKLKKNGIEEYLLKNEHIIRENDVKSISAVQKIGLYEYDIKVIFLKNSVFLVTMLFKEEKQLENIVDIITIKYKNPIRQKKRQPVLTSSGKKKIAERTKAELLFGDKLEYKDYKSIPDLYCLYEWKSGLKKIRIYDIQNLERMKVQSFYFCVNQQYKLEICNEGVLNAIIDNFKYTLRKIEEKRKSERVNASSQF